MSDVDELKRRVNNEWAGWAALNHAVIERAVGKWRQPVSSKVGMLHKGKKQCN